MRVSNSLAVNAIINLLQRKVLFNTKGQYMKESNTIAPNVTNNLFFLFNTKRQYMKESNTLVDSVGNI